MYVAKHPGTRTRDVQAEFGQHAACQIATLAIRGDLRRARGADGRWRYFARTVLSETEVKP